MLCREGGWNGPNAVEHDEPCAFLCLVRGALRVSVSQDAAGGARGLSTLRGHMTAPATAGRTSCSMRKSDAPETPLSNE